jgi:hypothetical protein
VVLPDAFADAEGAEAGGLVQAMPARLSGKIEVCRVQRPAVSAAVTWRWMSAMPTSRPR